jgi:predicted DCC family thiol-disulfide oxidoreductase YuxK
VLCAPSQTPGLRAKYALSREQTDFEAWVIELATGRKLSGAAALNRVWRELGGPLGQFARLYDVIVLRWIEDGVYRWVAANRQLLSRVYSTVPECERPGVQCEA